MISRLFLAASVGAVLACASRPAPIQNTAISQVLTIKLVRVSGDTVSGVLDAYRDPQCGCPVVTTFTGRVDGDTIDGSFTTRGSLTNTPQTGTWRVKRTTR